MGKCFFLVHKSAVWLDIIIQTAFKALDSVSESYLNFTMLAGYNEMLSYPALTGNNQVEIPNFSLELNSAPESLEWCHYLPDFRVHVPHFPRHIKTEMYRMYRIRITTIPYFLALEFYDGASEQRGLNAIRHLATPQE